MITEELKARNPDNYFYDYIFAAFLISLFVDYSLIGLTLTHVIIIPTVIFYFFKRKIDYEVLLLLFLIFPYLLVSLYLNLNGYTFSSQGIHISEVRPLFVYANVIIELLFLLIFLKEKAGFAIARNIFLYFMVFMLFLNVIGILDSSFLNNEPGIFASYAILTAYILYFKSNNISFKSLPSLLGILITKSSTIVIFLVILFRSVYRQPVAIMLFGILVIYMIIDGTYTSDLFVKLLALYNPNVTDEFGGRYWSNIIYIEMLQSLNMLFGYGLDSFNYFRAVNYPDTYIIFDHGGSDVLKLLSSFGIVGCFIMLTVLIKLFVKYNINLDIWGLVIVILMMLKGLGLFSSLGTMLLYLITSTKIERID